MGKKLIIAGNWKMNKTPSQAKALLKELKGVQTERHIETIICVPFIDIPVVVELTKSTPIKVGAQNCHFEGKGAFTGEISAEMLKEAGVKYVILGHSERRNYFSETDEIINKKIKTAVNLGLKVIFCVGETLQERENNITEEKIFMQIKNALFSLNAQNLKNLTIAYEPVWAIGAERSASNFEANRICGIIKKILADIFTPTISQKTPILYGGAINTGNAAEFFSMENIDGGLIGRASLDAVEFLQIIKIAANKT